MKPCRARRLASDRYSTFLLLSKTEQLQGPGMAENPAEIGLEFGRFFHFFHTRLVQDTVLQTYIFVNRLWG